MIVAPLFLLNGFFYYLVMCKCMSTTVRANGPVRFTFFFVMNIYAICWEQNSQYNIMQRNVSIIIIKYVTIKKDSSDMRKFSFHSSDNFKSWQKMFHHAFVWPSRLQYLREFHFFVLQIDEEAIIDTFFLFCLFSIKVNWKNFLMMHMKHKGY